MKFLLLNRNEELVCFITDSITAKHIEEINGENTLEFEVFDIEIEKGYRVVYEDKYGYWHEFIVRGIIEKHADEGITKEVFCENSFYETIGDYNDDLRPQNVTANIALANALSSTRWEVGTVDNLGLNSTNFYHEDAKTSVQKVAEIWKGEIRTRVTVSGTKITHRYVDLLAKRGSILGKRFTYGKDIEEISKIIQREDVYTALYGYGKGEELDTGGFGRRIDFADINSGKAYVENTEALAIWGRNNPDGTKKHIFGKVEFDDVTDKNILLQLTTEKLTEVSVPAITYEAKVQVFGLEHENVGLGDTAGIIDREFTPELRLTSRIIKIVEDLIVPENTEITFGNVVSGMTDELIKNDNYISNFRDKENIWDRANAFNPDGTLNANYIFDLLTEFNNQANSTGGYVFTKEGEGILTINTPNESTATMAIQIKGGLIRIANTKLPDGSWNWTTALDGSGIIASVINAGVLKGGKVEFDLENGTLLIGNSITDYQLLWDGTKLWLNGTGIEFFATQDFVQETVPHSVILSTESYPIPTDNTGKTISSISINIALDCFKGTSKIAGTIGTLQLKNSTGSLLSLTGITLSKVNPTDSASGSVTMAIDANITLGSDSGYIEIPITIESKTYYKRLIWTKAKQGAQGADGATGEDALSVILLNENQSIACNSGRTASSAQTITIPFAAYLGANRIAATAAIGTLPSGVTLGSNTAGTISADGVLVFNVASGANLGGTSSAYDSGTIDITITANGVSITRKFSYTKTLAGTAARTFFVEPNVSTIVKAEDGSYVPTSITFSAYYKDANYEAKTEQGRYWKIETTIDGTTWVEYATKTDAQVKTYTVTPIPAGIKGIKATTYADAGLVSINDSQSVMVVSNGATGSQGIQGERGADGATLYTWVKYATTPTSGMSDTPDGKVYIGLAYNKTVATESTNYADYAWSLIKGETGATGAKGADGVTTYTWIKYADDATGTGLSDSPTGKRYLGLAFNKTTPTESSNATDYSFSPLYDNVQASSRNLILNSNEVITSTSYLVKQYTLSEDLVANDEYTFVIKGTVLAGQKFGIWMNSGANNVGYATNVYRTGITFVTFKAVAPTTGNERLLGLYNYPSGTTESTVDWVALYRGNIPMDWMPAPEDIDADIQSRATQAALDAVSDTANNAANGVTNLSTVVDTKASQSDLDALQGTVTANYSSLSSDASSIRAEIGTVKASVDGTNTNVNKIYTYFDFQETGLNIGKSDSPLQINISNSEMDFLDNGKIVAYVNGQKMFIDSLEVLSSLIVGVHKIEKYNNDITLIKWVGGN